MTVGSGGDNAIPEQNLEIERLMALLRTDDPPVVFEVYYRPPANPAREAALTSRVVGLGGRLDYREDATEYTGICLTYEFDEKAM